MGHFSDRSRQEIEVLVSLDPRIALALRDAAQNRRFDPHVYLDSTRRCGCILGISSLASVLNIDYEFMGQILYLRQAVYARIGTPKEIDYSMYFYGHGFLQFERELSSIPACADELLDILAAIDLAKESASTPASVPALVD